MPSNRKQSLQELIERMERDPLVKRGYVATDKGFKPWQKSVTTGRSGSSQLKDVPQTIGELKTDHLPAIVKRTPQARVESLTRRLLDHMEESLKVYGEIRMPEDILNEIRAEYWKAGEPNKYDFSYETLSSVAKRYLEEAEMRAKYEKPRSR